MQDEEYYNDEDNVVAMCGDCLSTIPDEIAERDIFLQAGKTGVCKFCGGPVIVTYANQVDKMRRDREQGGHI